MGPNATTKCSSRALAYAAPAVAIVWQQSQTLQDPWTEPRRLMGLLSTGYANTAKRLMGLLSKSGKYKPIPRRGTGHLSQSSLPR